MRVEFADTGTALFSDCGTWRYRLTRYLPVTLTSVPGRSLTFVMLNPSTATASTDDPTIRRCIGYAQREGATKLRVVNLYALRSTDPKGLWSTDLDPVGPENMQCLTAALVDAWAENSLVVAAWGAHAKPEQVARFMGLPLAERVQALGVTKAGAPRHPLYLRADAPLTPWRMP